MSSKALWGKVHKWIGLTVAAFLIIQATTGTIILFRDDLNDLLYHEAKSASTAPVSVDKILETATAYRPDLHVGKIIIPSNPNAAYLVQYHNNSMQLPFMVAISPHEASIIHSGRLTSFPVEAAFELHYRLLLSKPGQILNGILALSLVIMLCSGIYLWWPKGSLKRGFQVKLSAARVRAAFDVHRVFAASASLLLLVVAITGFILAVPEVLGRTGKASTASGEKVETPASIDLAIQQAYRQLPNQKLKKISFTRSGHTIKMVFTSASSTPNPRAVDTVRADLFTGRTISITRYEEFSARSKILSWVLSLHSFDIAGWIGKLLAAISAIFLILISSTGIWLWWARRALQMRSHRTK